MGKLIDLTGQRFGRLTVIGRAGNDYIGQAMWRCQCDCGNVTVVVGGNLRTGNTQSCGCYGHELTISGHRSTTHGGTYDSGKRTRLYRIWRAMKTRCYNPNAQNYKDYGGRGITICLEWLHDFAAFRDWAISHGYRDDLTIDRIDNGKGYSPNNCRWATMKEQRANQRPIKRKL